MPVIETYSSTRKYSGSSLAPNMQDVSTFNRDAKTTGEIGKALTDLGDVLIQKETQKQKLDLAASVSQFKLDWMKQEEEIKNNLKPGEDYATVASQRAEEMMGTIQPGNYVKDIHQEQILQLREHIGQSVLNTQIQVSQEKARVAAQNALTNFTNGVKLDPSSFNFAASNIAELTKDLPLEHRDAAFNDAINSLKQARAEGIADRTPGKFLADYKKGLYNDVKNADGVAQYAEAKIKSFEAERSKRDTVLSSNLNYTIQTTDDLETLKTTSAQVEDSFRKTDPIEANNLQLKIHNRMKEVGEEADLATRGAVFASGGASVNPNNKDDVKAIDAYSKRLEKTIQSEAIPIDEANNQRMSLMLNSRYVPKETQGWLENMAVSTQKEDVQAGADLYSKIAARAPHMIPQLGSSDAIKRLSLVKMRLDRGIPMDKALEATDKILTPKSESEKIVLKEQAVKYTKDGALTSEALDLFNSWYSSDVGTDSRGWQNIAGDYRDTFMTTFEATGDAEFARKEAKLQVEGMYTRTSINGKPEVMKFAPDNYFTDPKRGITQEHLQKAVEQAGMSVRGISNNAPTNYEIVPDPYLTEKGARLGQPVYNLVGRDSNDTPIPMLPHGVFMTFDGEGLGKSVIDKAKSKAKEKSFFNPTNPKGILNPLGPIIKLGSTLEDSHLTAKGYKFVRYQNGRFVEVADDFK